MTRGICFANYLALILAFFDTCWGLLVLGTKTLSQLSVEILILPPKRKVNTLGYSFRLLALLQKLLLNETTNTKKS